MILVVSPPTPTPVPPLGKPSNLSATASSTPRHVSLHWTPGDNATKHWIVGYKGTQRVVYKEASSNSRKFRYSRIAGSTTESCKRRDEMRRGVVVVPVTGQQHSHTATPQSRVHPRPNQAWDKTRNSKRIGRRPQRSLQQAAHQPRPKTRGTPENPPSRSAQLEHALLTQQGFAQHPVTQESDSPQASPDSFRGTRAPSPGRRRQQRKSCSHPHPPGPLP